MLQWEKERAERAEFIKGLQVGSQVFLGFGSSYDRVPIVGTVVRFTAKQIVIKNGATETRARLEDGQILSSSTGMRRFVAPVTERHLEMFREASLRRWFQGLRTSPPTLAQIEAMKAAYESVQE